MTGTAAAAYPDLVADPPGAPELDQYAISGQQRLLLRFDGYVHNQGPGILEVRGSGSNVVQRVDGSDVPRPGAQILYETADGHNHFHLKSAARYSLWKGDRSAEVAPANKAGFCLLDSDRREGTAPQLFNGSCNSGNPGASLTVMGISPGWRDFYSKTIALQWVDVSGTTPGRYVVSSEVDPDNLLLEANESNPRNFADTDAVVPGYVATPINAGELPATGAPITLQASKFGSPGARQFKIIDPPDHGTLTPGTGNGWFSLSTLVYTPHLGYAGTDSFRYVARDSSSPFPFSPPWAGVIFGVGEAPQETAVAVSGAPGSMYAGTSAQLSAVVVYGPSEHLAWKVNGIESGTSQLGTITPSGLYRAPAFPPPGGAVTVSATTDNGATDSRRIQILPKPPMTPAPGIATPRKPRGALSRIKLHREGRLLIAKVVPGRSGTLKFVLRRGSRKPLASRKTRATKRRAVTTRFILPRGYGGRRARLLRVNVALRSHGKIVGFKRARVR